MLEQKMESIFQKYNDYIDYNLTNIDKKLLELPLIIAHYQNIFYTMQTKLNELDVQKAELWQAKFLYYKNEFDITLNNTEIKQFIDRDLEIINIIRKMNNIRLIANRAEDVVKSLRDFSWTIRTLIDYEKFKVGIV